jgi:Mrp family chromosome partitioning ATPase
VQIPWGNERLKLVPTGKIDDNAADLLTATNIDLIFDNISKDAESVILDGPPIFLAESSILCTKVDCVILVVRMGHTRRDAIKAVKDQLDILPINRMVIVLNRVDPNDTYNNKYYSLYKFNNSDSSVEKKPWKINLPIFHKDDDA